MLCNAVQLGSNLPLDALARIAKAINITPEGTIDVIDVPLSWQETAEERVRRILTKGGKLRELARSIHSDLVLKDPDNPPNYDLILRDVSAAADGGKEMGAGLTADQIYVFAKKCKDNSTRGFIDFIFKQTKGTISKNDIRIAVKRGEPKAAFTARAKAACEAGLPEPRRRGGLPRILTVIKRTEIETYAKKFYGYEARLAKKAEKKKQLATMRD